MTRRRTGTNTFQFPLTLAVLAATSLIGCASDEAARYYVQDRYAAKPKEQVELLSAPPTRPHVILADFQARNASADFMRSRAAEIGADAVIVTQLGGYAARDQVWASRDVHTNSFSRITGTAIKYKER